ncbi:MAG: excinuclease ABC subunit UvrA, partial [Bacteroidota bacterium]
DVDYIEGLSPSISIEQKTVSSNPRSTVGTVTEIYDYLRLLFARIGTQFCYNCGRKVQRQSVDQIIDGIMAHPKGSKLQILAPVIKGRKGHYRELFEQILKDGFIRVRVDGEVKQIEKGMKANRYKVHNIEIVVDRITVDDKVRSRIADSVEVALKFGEGVLIVNDGKNDQLFSQKYSCTYCGISYEEPAPNSFSFNSPAGHCAKCEGLGELKAFDLNLIMPDENLSINEEGIAALGKPRPTWMFSQVQALATKHGFDFDTPLKKITPAAKEALLYGMGAEKLEVQYVYDSGRTVTYKHRFDGLMKMLKRYYDETASNQIREWVESFMTTSRCEVCNGGRLRKESLAIKVEDAKTGGQWNIHDVVKLSVDKCLK